MGHWRKRFNVSDATIRACDLFDEETGKYIPVTVTIERIYDMEIMITGGKEMKTVLKLAEFSKPMVCNKSNFERLTSFFKTPDDRYFIGHPIILMVEEVKKPGSKDLTPALRFSTRPVLASEKVKPAIAPENFPTALENVRSGKLTKEKLMEQRSLTEEQIKQIDEIQIKK